MDLADEYLAIPEDYARSLGGLRWAPAGDAIDRGDGTTYAFAFQVGAFLEGYLGTGPLIHFAYILHALGFLRRGDPARGHALRGFVQEAFQASGRSHRNAGAFFATICRGVPPYPGAPVAADLLWRLQYPPHTQHAPGTWDPATSTKPQRPASWFEEYVVCNLEAYGFDDLLYWFRNGTGPVKDVSQLQEAVVARPASLAAALAELARSARLAGALPYVDQFVGALTLPRRRLARHDLPVGGYDDITTRGEPSQLLPGQLALEGDEFVRRFACGELLYFRREEPHIRTREDLVLLLDQGVRTWGPTRLLLAAAVMALGRYAVRRRLTLRVAATSRKETIDPLEADPGALAALVDASDLSPHPGEALERVLLEAATAPCDVVLLTHPRSLSEPDVCSAARTAPANSRLFALTASPSGAAELKEIRRGSPVDLLRFRVEANSARVAAAAVETCTGTWRGDTEAVPYPFRFGAPGYSGKIRMAFDYAGDWLLIATLKGILQAFRTDGSGTEIWPRPVFAGSVLRNVDAVIGVAGGFAVTGWVSGRLVVAHFDLATRTVVAYDSDVGDPARRARAWWYERQSHTLVAEQPGKLWRLELGSGRKSLDEGIGPSSVPNQEGPFLLRPLRTPSPFNVRTEPQTNERHTSVARPACDGTSEWPYLRFNPDKGSLAVGSRWGWTDFTPQSDGRPMLAGETIGDVDCRGATIAAQFGAGRSTVLRVFRGPEGVPVAEYPMRGGPFVLSNDGRLLALKAASGGVRVFEVLASGSERATAPVGRFHHSVELELGEDSLSLHNGVVLHKVRWGNGHLTRETPAPAFAPSSMRLAPRLPIPKCVTDGTRFVKFTCGALVAATDAFGQVAVFEYSGALVCMFFSFRHYFAAWAPDGTYFGSEHLTGTNPNPKAAEKIGSLLKQACARGPGRVPG